MNPFPNLLPLPSPPHCQELAALAGLPNLLPWQRVTNNSDADEDFNPRAAGPRASCSFPRRDWRKQSKFFRINSLPADKLAKVPQCPSIPGPLKTWFNSFQSHFLHAPIRTWSLLFFDTYYLPSSVLGALHRVSKEISEILFSKWYSPKYYYSICDCIPLRTCCKGKIEAYGCSKKVRASEFKSNRFPKPFPLPMILKCWFYILDIYR